MQKGHQNLLVWQKSMDLVVEVYKLVRLLPQEERFGLSSQMTRSAVSIPSNIAEGYRRQSDKAFKQFLLIAFGSGAELETQLAIVKRLNLTQDHNFVTVENLLSETMKILNTFINKTL